MIDKLFFMHVPKVAGTSIIDIVSKYYPTHNTFISPAYSFPLDYGSDRMSFYYEDINYYSYNTIRSNILNYYASNTLSFGNGLDRFFYYGHTNPILYFDIENPEKTKDIFLFTFLRSPLERLKSEYLFFKKSIRENAVFHDIRYLKMKSEKWSFEMYALHPLNLNLQSEMMFYVPIERFNFIGLYENIDNDWNDLCSTINISQQKLPKKNVNPDKEELFISKDLESQIRQYHWKDYCLYDRVRRQRHLA